MKTLTEWRKDEAVQVNREQWGYEIVGTVAEVMKILKEAPSWMYCIATVETDREGHQGPSGGGGALKSATALSPSQSPNSSPPVRA